jgi:tRNA-dihydrouridine synthase
MVHGRTYEGGFGGPVDFALAQKIKKIVPKKIVLLNGGITTPQQACDILTKYPEIDGLGIGRETLGRPWLFDEIKDLLQNPSLLSKERCREAIERYNFDKTK